MPITLIKRYGHINWILLDQAIVSAGNFISVVILARALGLVQFGQFSVVWLVVLFTSSIVMAVCVFPMMTNYCLLPVEKRPQYLIGTFGTFIYAVGIWIVISLALYLMLALLDFKELEVFVFPLMACVIAIHFQDFVRRMLITMGRRRLAVISDGLTYLLRIGVLAFLWEMEALDIVVALNVFTMTSFIGAFVVYALPFNMNLRQTTCFAWAENRKSAKWLLPSGLLQWSSINLFISAAAFLLSPAAVGVIRICQSLLAVLNVLIQGLENIVPLRASKLLSEHGAHSMVRYLVRVSMIGVVPVLILIIVCSLFGGEIIAFVYGEEYRDLASLPLVIYSIAYIFVFLIVPVRAGLRSLDETREWFNAYVASSIFSLSIVYFIEVNYNVLGAVWGILLAHVVLIGYSLVMLSRKLKMVVQ